VRKYLDRDNSKSATWPLTLFVLLSVIMASLSTRMIDTAKWNSWTIQYMWHALNSNRAGGIPSSIPAGYDRARIWLARGAVESGDPQRALTLLESIALKGDPFALHIQVAALEQQGNFAGALEILIHTQDYRLLAELGDTATAAGDRENALAAYTAAYKINPELESLPLVDFLTNSGSLGAAEAILKNDLTTYPKAEHRLSWYRRLADNLRDQNRLDEAEAVYQSALVEFPADWALHIGLGWVYYERGDGVQQATQEFQKAISIDKTRGDGYFAMAQLLTREKQFAETDDWYRVALERDQTHNWWYITRANSARSAGDFTLALSIYGEAAGKFPKYSTVYYEMALAFYLNNQPGEARTSIEKALSLMDPPSASYYARAGQIFEQNEEPALALEAYRNALAIDPKNSAAMKGVSHLSEP
jgi:tetratricopeptide (TPR) repeat protein